MSFNFSELQQKADRVLHNADEFVRRYVQFALAPAQDITVQYYDQNGNLQTGTFPNRQKLVNQFFNDVNSAMTRTYFVDWNNGNDGNDGTQERPFKTLYKAINSVPMGGYGEIVLLSDYTLNDHLFIVRKRIRLNLNGKTLATVYYGVQGGEHLKYCIQLVSSSLEIVNFGKIYVPNKPDSRPIFSGTNGFIGSGTYMGGCSFSEVYFILGISTPTPHVWAEVLSGSLVAYNNADDGILSHMFVGLYPHYNCKMLLGSNAYFINAAGRPFTIGALIQNNNWTGYIERYNPSTGQYQQIPISQAIAGVIRHANTNIPVNVISGLTAI